MIILEFSPNKISDDDHAHSVTLEYKGRIFLMLDCSLGPGRDKVPPFHLLLLPRASMFENNLLHSTLYKDLGGNCYNPACQNIETSCHRELEFLE